MAATDDSDAGVPALNRWDECVSEWLVPEHGGRVRVVFETGLAPLPPALLDLGAELVAVPAIPPGAWEAGEPDAEPPAATLERLLYFGTAHARDMLVLFGRAYRELNGAGRLLLLDHFCRRRGEPGDGHLSVDQLQSLASRAGFVVEAELPVSLPWPPRGGGAACVPRGLLVAFRRVPAVRRWRVTWQEPHRLAEVRALFARVFGHAMSEALWRWKYGGGRGQGALAIRDGEVVGHYGVLTRSVRYLGRPERAAQVADVMVEPGDRGVLTRRGAFFLTAASMPEACCGYGSKHLIGFGFPNHRAFRVAERLGLYASVDRITELSWPAVTGERARWAFEDLAQRSAAQASRLVDRLWTAMAGALGEAIVGVRDYAWVRYRYLRHPEHDYRVLVIRTPTWRRALGVIVLRLHDDRAELMDVIAPPARLESLVAAAREAAGRAARSQLFCWASSRCASYLDTNGASETDPDVCIPTSIHTAGPSPAEITGRWWLMSGDTDFR